MLTGLLEPSGGLVLLDGANVREDLVDYKRGLGYVPEEAQLYTWMSGAEYLTFCARLRGLPNAVARAASTPCSRSSACRPIATRR